ncbi:hypothetical protein [Clostridium formicaceticum]|uniref:Uncharacterized protein n=1 Tax=Clostridium formicaceticum TaxID=1497 RepID=A0AAC9RRV3_9CLOT|nr:hypothetical protein [Clostridium formicaceticum]ARE89793.1 hypothetical protein CLFO_42740 [Clostridium formicaceticum]
MGKYNRPLIQSIPIPPEPPIPPIPTIGGGEMSCPETYCVSAYSSPDDSQNCGSYCSLGYCSSYSS